MSSIHNQPGPAAQQNEQKEAAPVRYQQGCCADKACTDSTCMDLPKGLTCGDCVHERRCCTIFGHTPTDTYCDWFPRRFHAKAMGAAA